MNNELYHHGIKGQKWGRRRWQNPDGSLTDDGYVHYGYAKKTKYKSGYVSYDLTKKGVKYFMNDDGTLNEKGKNALKKTNFDDNEPEYGFGKTKNELKKEAGIYSKDGDDYIPSNTKMLRLAGGDETIDNKRKYLSVTSDDKHLYSTDESGFFESTVPDLHYDQYVSNKTLKVASYDKVFEYIYDEIKDKKVSDLKNYETIGHNEVTKEIVNKLKNVKLTDVYKEANIYKDKSVKYNDKSIESKFVDAYTTGLSLVGGSGLTIIDNQSFNDKMTDHFVKKGYDAIVDANDSYSYANYPIIVLNPGKTLKRTAHKKEITSDMLK